MTTATAAMVDPLAAYNEKVERDKLEAEITYEKLAVALAGGEDVPADIIADCLSRVGRDAEHLQDAVRRQIKRQEYCELAGELPSLTARHAEVEEEIVTIKREFEERLRPLQQRAEPIEQRIYKAESAQLLLVDSAPKWLQLARGRIENRMTRLEKVMRKKPGKRLPHLIIADGHQQYRADNTLEERLAEYERFQQAATELVAKLQSRWDALALLAQSPAPTRDDLARISKSCPEPPRLHGPSYALAGGGSEAEL